MQGCEVGAYPFSSLDKAIDVFLTGSPDAEAHRTKLALLVYSCADAGIAIEADSIRCVLKAGSNGYQLSDVVSIQCLPSSTLVPGQSVNHLAPAGRRLA